MNIVQTSKELTAQETYFLTMSPSAQKMKDLVSQTIEISSYCVYEEVNTKGEEQTILSIKNQENEVFATNSPTFINDFLKMNELFASMGETVHAVKVISGTSKSGREFITCVYER